MSTPSDPTAAAIAALRSGDPAQAIVLAEEALAGADSALVRHLLGVCHCRLGQIDAGIVHLRRAAALDPGDAQVMLMLMRALIDAGRPDEALALGFAADGLPSPVVAALWRTRAEAAHASGDAALEADALSRVVQLDPGDEPARDLLVTLLLAIDRGEAALAELDMLPPSRQRRRQRSAALVALRRFDEAAALDAELLAEDSSDRASWLSAVLIADRQGDVARLDALAGLAGDAGYAAREVDFARALVAKKEGRLEQALALAEACEVLHDPAHGLALAASLADRLGRPGEAMAAAAAKSRATANRDHWIERGSRHRAGLEALLAAMTPQWAGRWAAPPPLDRPAPVFLVGFPRSGTTLLDTFLMGHPGLLVIEEEDMLDLAGRELGAQPELDRVDEASILRARAAYFAALERHVPKGGENRLPVDKLPLAMTGAPAIKRLFPDAKFIFAMRHPADCVVSNLVQAFRLNDAMANFLDLEGAAQFYDVAMRVWTRAVDLLDLDTHVVRYEDLVGDPEAVLRPLIAWLGLEWDPALLDHRATAAKRGAIVTPSYDQVTQPLHRRAAGRWQRYADMLEPVRPLIEPWAIRHGYGPMVNGAGEG